MAKIFRFWLTDSDGKHSVLDVRGNDYQSALNAAMHEAYSTRPASENVWFRVDNYVWKHDDGQPIPAAPVYASPLTYQLAEAH